MTGQNHTPRHAPEAHDELDSSLRPVPPSARMGKGALAMAWWGVCSALFYIFLAATLTASYGPLDTLIGMALSVLCYGVINSLIARYAIRTGMSVSMLSRLLFGRSGSVLATLIFCATAAYYAIFEGAVIAVAASKVIAGLDYATACVLVVLYSVPLVMGSVQAWLDKLNGVLLPFFLVGLGLAAVMAANRYGFDPAWLGERPAGAPSQLGWLEVFFAYTGVWVLMMFTMDYARFGRIEDIEFHARFNFGTPFYVMTFLFNGTLGVYLVVVNGLAEVSETVVVDALIQVLGGALALAFIWVTQTRINSANYHLATVNLQASVGQATGRTGRRWLWAVLVGAVVLLLMRSTNVFGYILAAMQWQAIFVTAWVAVTLCHILGRRGASAESEVAACARAPAFVARGLSAWCGAAMLGIVMAHAGGSLAPWAPAVAFSAAVLGYLYFPWRSRAPLPASSAGEGR